MLTLAIQAGGESQRMGQDKALAPFLGQPLIVRILQRLQGLADEVLVTTNSPTDYATLDVRIVADPVPGRGALGGLYTALSAASQPLVAVVACDMPFANADLLAAERDILLASNADIAIPRTPAGLEPFHAVYRRETCLLPCKAALEAGKWRADAWFGEVRVRELRPEETARHDPRGLAFLNVNTREELTRAEEIAITINS